MFSVYRQRRNGTGLEQLRTPAIHFKENIHQRLSPCMITCLFFVGFTCVFDYLLWPGDAMWRQRTMSLVQVVTCSCSTPTQLHEPNVDSFATGPCWTNFNEIEVNIIESSSVCKKIWTVSWNFMLEIFWHYISENPNKRYLFVLKSFHVTGDVSNAKR